MVPPVFQGGREGESSDALGHVQRSEHLFEDGSFHVGPSEVGFLEITARQVTVLSRDQDIYINVKWTAFISYFSYQLLFKLLYILPQNTFPNSYTHSYQSHSDGCISHARPQPAIKNKKKVYEEIWLSGLHSESFSIARSLRSIYWSRNKGTFSFYTSFILTDCIPDVSQTHISQLDHLCFQEYNKN